MKASLQAPFPSYIIRKLEPNEKVKSFDCGDADLNDFILNESGLYRQALLAVTYVFEAVDDEAHEHVAAYSAWQTTGFLCLISRTRLRSIAFANIVLSTRKG